MLKRFALLCLSLLACVHAVAESAPRWLQVKTEHFTVITDGSDGQARRIAAQFERMQSLFAKLLPHAQNGAGSPIVVLALKNRKGFQALEPAAYLQKNALDLAGYFQPQQDKSYILLRLDTSGEHPYSTVYHEYTHYLMRDLKALPLWLNEGLAEFYQNTDLDEKTARLGQPSVNEIRFLREQRLLPLTTLFAVDHSSLYYHEEDKGNIFYAESWALTHWLMIQDFKNHTERIRDYSLFLTRGEEPISAAQHAFGDLKVLGKSLDEYVNQGSFSMFTLPLQNTVKEAALPVESLSTPDADAIRADVLLANGRKEDARVLIESVLKEAPDNAQAHESMGLLELRQGNMRDARKWYGEAVALHATSYLAYYDFGSLSMQLGNGDGATDETVGASLRKAVELNPNFAPAQDALAQFDARHDQLDEAAQAILQAVELDPSNIAYRLNASQIRVQRKDWTSAISILEMAEKEARNPEDLQRVKARLEQLQHYRAQMAQAESFSQPGSAPGGASSSAAPESGTEITADDGHVLHPTVLAESRHQFPVGPPSGARHTVKGVLRSVSCVYPKGLTLSVDGSGRPTPLYSNDMYAIQFTAGNFKPTKDLNPCKEFEGMKASVVYAQVSDEIVVGQIVSMELSK